jgi:hypothetical protein
MAPNAVTVYESMIVTLINLRDQPEPDKEAWHAFFDHDVCGPKTYKVSDHRPGHWQTVAGKKSPQRDNMDMKFSMDRLAGR